jgi:hypothetical protein
MRGLFREALSAEGIQAAKSEPTGKATMAMIPFNLANVVEFSA